MSFERKKIMSNRIKKKQETKSSFQESAALIMGIFTLVVLCIFPLVFHNYYFDILETKYQFYCVTAISAIVVMALYGLVSGRLVKYFKAFNGKALLKRLNAVDWAMLAFWLCNVISWLLCKDWKWDAFWGTLGRYNGVFLVTIYMIVYFLMTRFFHFRQWYLDAFLAVGIFVCIFGITDYFQMDILHFKVRMVDNQKGSYTSTFGNINTYTIYVGVVMVVSMILFALEENRNRMLWYYGNMVLSIMALIMGISDNAYLTIAALFGFAPLYLFRTKRGLRRYLISLATFFSMIPIIDWINHKYADTVLGIQSMFNILAEFDKLPALVAGLWVLAAVVTVLTMKRKGDSERLGKWLSWLWVLVIAAVIGLAAYVLYDANIAGNAEKYSAVKGYVVFNEAWGTHRGFVWIRAMDVFNTKFTSLQKLFGFGPETFSVLMQYYFSADMEQVLFDNAHNEYLHYLLTIGIAGMVSYAALMVSAVVRMAKNMKGRPEVAAVMFAIAAYMVQAFVNLNLPIAMPIIIHILAMGLSKRSGDGDQQVN